MPSNKAAIAASSLEGRLVDVDEEVLPDVLEERVVQATELPAGAANQVVDRAAGDGHSMRAKLCCNESCGVTIRHFETTRCATKLESYSSYRSGARERARAPPRCLVTPRFEYFRRVELLIVIGLEAELVAAACSS